MWAVVMGGGAMGAVFASALSRGGASVSIVDPSSPLVAKLRADGLRVTDPDRSTKTFAIAASTEAPRGRTASHVLFAVKSQHTRAAATMAADVIGPGTVLVTIQNGWGNDRVLYDAYPDNPIVLGVTYSSATVLAPGDVHFTARGRTMLGGNSKAALAEARTLGVALESGGLPCDVTADARSEGWRKLVLNAAILPPSAILGITMGDLGKSRDLQPLVAALTAEAVAVGKAEGLSVDLDERRAAIDRLLEGAGSGKASMLQDLEAGRQTEIDAINGAVVELGKRHGVPTPTNEVMVALVRAHQAVV
jgi:2-dehydropantoate 2-reductase